VTATPHDRSHYSYSAYADPAMADGFDAARFRRPDWDAHRGGPRSVCCSTSCVQRRAAPCWMWGRAPGGRPSPWRAGATVTGIDASGEMLRVARERAGRMGLAVRFDEGDAHAVAVRDRAFDVCVSLRV